MSNSQDQSNSEGRPEEFVYDHSLDYAVEGFGNEGQHTKIEYRKTFYKVRKEEVVLIGFPDSVPEKFYRTEQGELSHSSGSIDAHTLAILERLPDRVKRVIGIYKDQSGQSHKSKFY